MDKHIRNWCSRMVAAITVAFIATAAGAQATWHVDIANDCPGSGSEADPFCAIQSAIDHASDDDEIIVAPGTYNEAIDFEGKAIHLQSSDGPDVTIIDASGLSTSVVTCSSGEGSDTILEGFTITGGNASQGGGMRNFGANPTVINCHFIGNTASSGAGASNNSGSNPTFTNCRFEDNTAANNGGGIHNVNFSTATVNNSFFASNSANSGGAIFNSGGTFCSSHVADSTFCENTPTDIFGTWHDEGGNEFLDECPVDCPADLTGSGDVGVSDLLELLAEWGVCDDPDDCPADLTGTGSVGVADLLELLAQWGPCP